MVNILSKCEVVGTLSNSVVSAGGPCSECWWSVHLYNIGSGECDQIGRGTLCTARVGCEAPLLVGGKWHRGGLFCSACLCTGLHKVPSADAFTYSGDVCWRGWNPYSSYTGIRAAGNCEGAPGLLSLEKKTAHRRRCQLKCVIHPLPRQDWPSSIHTHSPRLCPRCQGAQVKSFCYFYW